MSEEAQILEDLGRLSNDPLRFVHYAFPWGAPGELEGASGPEQWQTNVLAMLRDGLLNPAEAIQIATKSGRGVGKSSLVSWILLWAISTAEDTKGIVTANTENQLKTKTWAELAKWYRLFIGKQFFKMTATSLVSRDPEHELDWRIDMVPWSEKNPTAFQGLHNYGKRFVVIFDEASAIDDAIWEATEGSFTDRATQRIWAVFGNPTRSTGRFRDCFERFAHRWRNVTVDSRLVSLSDQVKIKEWIEDWGDDSDFVRVHVLGEFPRIGLAEFISNSMVVEAQTRPTPEIYMSDPLILGVDVARFGDDESVIYFRKGRDGRTYPPLRFRGLDTVELAGKVAEIAVSYRADAIFVDGTGVGAGVVDNLRRLKVFCFDVNFSSKADRLQLEGDASAYANKRAEMWGYMRAWLKGGAIPDDETLRQQLVGPMYGFNKKDEILLERKEDMKKRGLESPDMADALALTFAYEVSANAFAGYEKAGEEPNQDWNPFERFAA